MKQTTHKSVLDLKRIVNNKLIHFSFIVILSLLGPLDLASQSLTVNGNVVSEQDGSPLPGVNVYEKGTMNGTVTNLEGEYTITVSSSNATLVFSYIGYLTSEIPIEGRNSIDVSLKEDVLRLDEVVAIGYGKMKKSDLTGSVHSINTSDIETGAFNSIEKQLSGKVPGVNITQISGQPGSGTTIRIRGTNSIMGNNEPLFVIDGVPYGNGIGADINPNDIESIEILKDASSTAIYGARGANGVVLITTRSGAAGKTRVNFEAYYGMNVLDRKIDLLNAEELAEVHRKAIENGVTQSYDPDAITGEGTDWQDELYSPAPVQNYQLSLSGGNEKTNYFISANYLDEKGIVHNSDYKRYAFRTDLSTQVSKKLSVGGNIYVTRSARNVPRWGVIGAALEANPIYPVKDEIGNYLIYTDPMDRTMNPVAAAKLQVRERNSNKVLGNFNVEYNILDNLTANIRLGANLFNNKNNNFDPKTTLQGVQNNGFADINISDALYWVNNNTLTYDKAFENNTRLNVMAGFTAEKQRVEQVYTSSSDYITDVQEYHSLESGENQYTSSNLYEYQLASFISRANYNIHEKYLLTVSGRYDGSSRFGKDNRWAFFPSAAFAWRISNEDFLENNTVLSDLKFRTSWGVSGEQAIASYQTLPALSTTATLFAGDVYRIGFIPSRLANPALEWEKTEQFDAGIDAAFLNGRISITADAYYKKTTDLLYMKAIPRTSGYSSILSNVGAIENKGFEFYLRSVNTTGSFKWSSEFNIAFNRNKILDLGNNPDGSEIERIVSPAGAQGGYDYLGDQNALILGEPIGGAYGYVFDGTYKSIEEISAGPEPDKMPGDPKYRDIDDDGDVDTDDRMLISNPHPDFTGGFNNTFSYKGFELSIFLQWVVGNELFNYNHFKLSYMDGINNTQPWALDSWGEDNPNSDIPRAGWDNRTKGMSTFHVEDGSYLRARNITLSYNFSEKTLPAVESMRIYFSIDNAFTITNYTGYNPDVSLHGSNSISSGFDESLYPLAKVFLFGVNVEF